MIDIVAVREHLKVMDTPADKIRRPARARISAQRRHKTNRRKLLRRVSKGACLGFVFAEVSAIHLECLPAAVIFIIAAFAALGAAIILD